MQSSILGCFKYLPKYFDGGYEKNCVFVAFVTVNGQVHRNTYIIHAICVATYGCVHIRHTPRIHVITIKYYTLIVWHVNFYLIQKAFSSHFCIGKPHSHLYIGLQILAQMWSFNTGGH